MVRRRWQLAWLPGLFAFVGCQLSPDGIVVTRTDSAGVEIIEIGWSEVDVPPVAPALVEMVLEVGAVSGDPNQELFRVGAIRWLGPDRLALTNSGPEVRIYDLEGNLLRRMGSRGEGPGEFGGMSGLGVTSSGELVVTDTRTQRVTVFDSLGLMIGTTPVETGLPGSNQLLGDRWMVGKLTGMAPINGPRIERRTDSIVAVDITTGQRQGWAATPGVMLNWVETPEGFRMPLGMQLTPVPQLAVGAEAAVFGAPDRYELSYLDTDGTLVRKVRMNRAASPVLDGHREPYEAEWVRDGSLDFTRPVYRDSIPHFRALLLDDVGRTWVRLDDGFYDEGHVWEVFAADGSLSARVTLPPTFTPHAIRGELIAGITRNAMDVEFLQVWRLSLSGPEGR